MDEAVPTPPPSRSRRLLPLDVLRGALIGTAELVPGVSGGTVALVTGVYEQLLASVAHVVAALRRLVMGPDRLRSAATELRRTDWWLVVPVLAGMALAVVTVAGAMHAFVAGHPEHARGLFLGLVAVSVLVPLRMLPRAGARPAVDVLLLAGSAVVAWLLVAFAAGDRSLSPTPVVVLLVAAVAVCALVVPGVSGSFLLLAVGLYPATLQAVDTRDLGYLGVFAVGAGLGLATFVPVLRRLLERHRRTTLLVMTGLMLGSLRALWPWQAGGDDGPGALVGPAGPVLGPVLLALLGAAVVGVLVAVESRRTATVPD